MGGDAVGEGALGHGGLRRGLEPGEVRSSVAIGLKIEARNYPTLTPVSCGVGVWESTC